MFNINPRTLALLDQCIVSGSGFLTLVILGRFLGAPEFGLFSLAMLATIFLANLHRAVFTQPMNVLGAGEPAAQSATRLRQVLGAHLLAIPLSMALLGAVSFWFFPDPPLLLACCAYLSCFFLQETARRFWYTRQKMARALCSDAISYGGQLLLLLAAGLFWRLDGPSAFLIMAATSLLAFVVDVIAGGLLARAQTHTGNMLAAHWAMSKWLVLTVLAVWGATQLFPFLLAPLGAATVAAFVACRNLLNVINVLTQTIGDFLPVRAALLLRQQGRDALRKHLTKSMLQCLVAGSVFLLVMILVAEPLLDLVYKGLYNEAAGVLVILAIGRFFSLFAITLGAYSHAMQDARASFIANIGATLSNATVGLWLIKTNGAAGAAWAATLGMLVATMIQAVLVRATWRKLPHAAHAPTPVQAVATFAGGGR
ncbi:MAG: polysaccharide biosynthesis C-terminal domain-containing protein [Lacisediminimonas sp.]|nr:polysaccharide biosynthesis C-terminal domain-containing protein [Lacisediminimonas sp.]